jgi:hypothetical protein
MTTLEDIDLTSVVGGATLPLCNERDTQRTRDKILQYGNLASFGGAIVGGLGGTIAGGGLGGVAGFGAGALAGAAAGDLAAREVSKREYGCRIPGSFLSDFH